MIGEAVAAGRVQKYVLLLSILATGFSGMIAEYSVSTAVGYLAGSSVAAYSILISTFMLCMGIGAYASRSVRRAELDVFLLVQIVLSVLCAASTVLLSQAARVDRTWEAGLLLGGSIGVLIGFEIPLLLRINDQRRIVLRDNVALVFGADYLGSFVAGLTFSLVLLPRFGLVMTPIIGGAANLAVAGLVTCAFWRDIRRARAVTLLAGAIVIAGTLMVRGEAIVFSAEQAMYEDPIVYAARTRYQRIVITEARSGFCLYLEGQTQLCSVDEARYHESLVHPAFALAPDAQRVLVLGGGDGIAARQVLQYAGTEVTLVDLDPGVLALARTDRRLVAANGGALTSPRVRTVAADAMRFLATTEATWDVILIDLPDPSTPELAKLYSVEMYRLVRRRLAPAGVVVTQATSPIHATKAFVTIRATLQAAGFATVPYRTNVPTFGDWGFVIAMRDSVTTPDAMLRTLDMFEPRVPTRHLNRDAMQAAIRFEKGILPDDPSRITPSSLLRPTVLDAYDSAWRQIK